MFIMTVEEDFLYDDEDDFEDEENYEYAEIIDEFANKFHAVTIAVSKSISEEYIYDVSREIAQKYSKETYFDEERNILPEYKYCNIDFYENNFKVSVREIIRSCFFSGIECGNYFVKTIYVNESKMSFSFTDYMEEYFEELDSDFVKIKIESYYSNLFFL